MNIDDGGKNSRATALSGSLKGILAGSKLMFLRRCNVGWSLDADAKFLQTEVNHLKRLVQPLLGRQFDQDERLPFPEMENKLPDEAINEQGDSDAEDDADVLAGYTLAEYEQHLRADYREEYDAIVQEALAVDERVRAAAGQRIGSSGRKKRATKEGEAPFRDEQAEEVQRQKEAAKLRKAEEDKAERARVAAENKIVRRMNNEEVDRAADEKLALKYGSKSEIEQHAEAATAKRCSRLQRWRSWRGSCGSRWRWRE